MFSWPSSTFDFGQAYRGDPGFSLEVAMSLDISFGTRAWLARSTCRAELLEFGHWLQAERYGTLPCNRHMRRVACVLERLAPDGRRRVYTDRQLSEQFGRERSPPSRRLCFDGSRRAYRRFLQAAGRLVQEPDRDRFASLRADYAQFLIDTCGYAFSTRQHHAQEVRDLLSRGLRPRQPLRQLTREDVERHIRTRSREVTRQSLVHVAGILRGFLRYLYLGGHIPAPLHALDMPKLYRGEQPPKALPWRTVRTLLASVDRHSKGGWRDLCILHLLACYGLRPSEVAPLCADDIDWQRGLLAVRQRKTRSDLELPLAAPTLRLLRQYLDRHRNQQGWTHPQLFLRSRCPTGPIERTALCDIFDKRAAEAGLPPSIHVYQLRHSFAMRLLARGVGIKAIGDVMGHRSIESTCAYLRLDTRALRGVALPVPRFTPAVSEVRCG